MNMNCFHSHYWKLSFSKALSTDSQTFRTVSLCFAMCFRENEDKTWTLGGGYLKYFISAAHAHGIPSPHSSSNGPR